MSYSDLIKAFRKDRKLTHQQFADAVGVSRGAVQQWEKSETAPTRKNQPSVARYMGISVSELMAGSGAAGDGKTLKQTDKEQIQGLPAINTKQLLVNQSGLSADAVRLARWFDGIPDGMYKNRAFAECMGRINEWLGKAEQSAAHAPSLAAETSTAEFPAQPAERQTMLKTGTGHPGQ